jgi:hypothetical protein
VPGPISDSYDPEWGTGERTCDIAEQLGELYSKVSEILQNKPAIHILDLVEMDLPTLRQACLSEKEWRLLRFCIERAKDSI